MPKGIQYKSFDGGFEKSNNIAKMAIKPTSNSMPRDRASLGVKQIKKLTAMLPNSKK